MKMVWVQAVGQLLKIFVKTHCQWVIVTKECLGDCRNKGRDYICSLMLVEDRLEEQQEQGKGS